MSLFKKDEKELEVGSFFTKRYNHKHNTDYIVVNDPEDRDMDCIMKSEKIVIGLQLTTYDSLALETNAKHKNKEERLVFNPKRIKCIIKAIRDKNNGILKDFPLLIWSNGLTGINENYLKKETKAECDKSNFKEIYVIRLPIDTTDIGDVTQIK